ncbi:MAG: GTP-dependent dephospho-CoA kinase family protein [Methanomicrobiaceae archaeon]|nr:GTP-dependent dephospho-CoA kinase family protein [Methanomicrobiaceae archaeon]
MIPLLEKKTVYTVGDVVTRSLIDEGITPSIAIIDGHTMREPCRHTPILLAPRIHVENPPGVITDELIEAIRQAVREAPMVIIVKGEEDLAVIPLVILAPLGGIVLYGQPGKGVVVKEVTPEAKKQAEQMLALFARKEKNPDPHL